MDGDGIAKCTAVGHCKDGIYQQYAGLHFGRNSGMRYPYLRLGFPGMEREVAALKDLSDDTSTHVSFIEPVKPACL